MGKIRVVTWSLSSDYYITTSRARPFRTDDINQVLELRL